MKKIISLLLACTVVLTTLTTALIPHPALAVASDLFISEYIEGSSYNKAIEIYNGTGTSVDLSQYKLEIYFNGSTSAGSNITLAGTLASGSVYVVAHSSAGTAVKSKANMTTASLSFNGNDAVVLKRGTTVSDCIGQVGYNPGVEWGTGYTSTADNTLVRKSSVTAGDTTTNDAFDPSLQWDGYALDTFTYLGSHTMNEANVPVSGVTLNKSNTTIGVGQAETLVATVQPSNATNKNVTWSTSNPSVATVSTSGVVTGAAVGTAVITVTTQDGGYTATCTATVTSATIYNYYYGQLHSHTGYSDGTGTPSQAYAYARDTGHADFFAVTDHSNYFDNDLDWTKSTEWADTKQQANNYNVDGQFVAIAGFEMTWSNGTGHMNTFNTDWFESRNNTSMTLSNYYNKIAAYPNSFSQWNHPGTTFGDFSGFANFSAANDGVIDLIEVANGSGPVRGTGYYPSYDYYWQALDKGWHVAPTINQDNHKADWVTANEARTVVLATGLTRANVFDAIKNGRVYATEDKDLKLMYKANGSVMGAVLGKPATLDITVNVSDADTGDNISKIEVITAGGTVAASSAFSANTVNWNTQLPATNKYYYVKVTEADGDYAFSAPIWTGL